jgi:hypothetical protein
MYAIVCSGHSNKQPRPAKATLTLLVSFKSALNKISRVLLQRPARLAISRCPLGKPSGGCYWAVSLTAIFAVLLPVMVGVKVAAMVQLAPLASALEQLFIWAKSPIFVTDIPLKNKGGGIN